MEKLNYLLYSERMLFTMKTRIMTVDLENDLRSSRCRSMETVMPKLLELFDKYEIKATFFTVTSLLDKYESELKEIAKKHEIASHSHTHAWLNETNAEFEIGESKKKLEEYGFKCEGFRAPGAIITNNHFRLLKKYGYTYDSSLATFFPGRYINLNLPGKPFIKNGIQEFPIPTFIYPSVNSGLTYLKLLHPVSRLFSQQYMFYLHPWELLEKNELPRPRSILAPFLRRNSGKEAWKILKDYLNKEKCRWVSCKEFLNTQPFPKVRADKLSEP